MKKIVITTDGKITTAKLYDGKECVKVSEARCCPSDKFYLQTGAKIALERLFEEPDFWADFAAGKICVKLDEENMGTFLKSCDAHNIKWNDGKRASKINPFENQKGISEPFTLIVKALGMYIYKFAYIACRYGKLTFSNHEISGKKQVEFCERVEFDWGKFKTCKLAVKVTNENCDAFLKAAESHGCKWRNGELPTKYKPNFDGVKARYVYCLSCDDEGVFGHSANKPDGVDTFEW